MRAMRRDIGVIVGEALDSLVIELPSWGFANTGTRFGKFMQAAAARRSRRSSPTQDRCIADRRLSVGRAARVVGPAEWSG